MKHIKENKVIDFIINHLKFGEFSSITPSDINFKIETVELSRIYKIAESENLITKRSRTYIGLTKKGYDIQKSGGWLKHLENLEHKKQKHIIKDNLDIDIKILQKENFKYQKTIRDQNDKIRDLSERLKYVSLLKHYWWLITTSIGIGWILGQFFKNI